MKINSAENVTHTTKNKKYPPPPPPPPKSCKIIVTMAAVNGQVKLRNYYIAMVLVTLGKSRNFLFLDEFKAQVFDSDKQVWSARMSSMPKLRTLELFKTNISVEKYLLLHIPRRQICKVPVNERFCKLCLTLNENHIGDEYHVLLKCSFYEDFRKIYLCFNYDPLNVHTFISMMCTQNQEELVQLACFVAYQACLN